MAKTGRKHTQAHAQRHQTLLEILPERACAVRGEGSQNYSLETTELLLLALKVLILEA